MEGDCPFGSCQLGRERVAKALFREDNSGLLLGNQVRAFWPETRENAPVAQLDRASDYESEGRTFESFRARHFGTELGTPKPAFFTLSAATSVRRSALFDPMM